jgi:hypothetical protein
MTRRSFAGLILPACSGWSLKANTAPHLDPQSVYVDSFVFSLPGHVQRMPKLLGIRAVYIFFPDGHLDVLECGLEYNSDTKRLRALLAGAVVEHGSWNEQGRSSVRLVLPCRRLPPPPGAVRCKPPEIFVLQRTVGTGPGARNALNADVNGNDFLVAAPDLHNLHTIETLLQAKHFQSRQ